MVHQPVGDCRQTERVEARAQDGADLRGVDPERVHGAERVAQQPALDRRRTPLQVAPQEVVVQLEVAPLDAAAGEDAFGELVAAQAQPVEDLILGKDVLAVGDREPGDPRAGLGLQAASSARRGRLVQRACDRRRA